MSPINWLDDLSALRTSGGEASSQLTGAGTYWDIASWNYIIITIIIIVFC